MSFARKRIRVKVVPTGATLTEQHFRDRQDVNSIVARCLRGDISGLKTCGVNADISEVATDLHTMLNTRLEAERVYDSLPVEVREKYRTPSDFISACGDESQRETLQSLGLLNVAEEVKPIDVKIVNPVTPEGAAAS